MLPRGEVRHRDAKPRAGDHRAPGGQSRARPTQSAPVPTALRVSNSESSEAWFVQATDWKERSLPGSAFGRFQKLLPKCKCHRSC